jgi:hypothetical protein
MCFTVDTLTIILTGHRAPSDRVHVHRSSTSFLFCTSLRPLRPDYTSTTQTSDGRDALQGVTWRMMVRMPLAVGSVVKVSRCECRRCEGSLGRGGGSKYVGIR